MQSPESSRQADALRAVSESFGALADDDLEAERGLTERDAHIQRLWGA